MGACDIACTNEFQAADRNDWSLVLGLRTQFVHLPDYSQPLHSISRELAGHEAMDQAGSCLMLQEAVTGEFGELARLLLDHGGRIWEKSQGQVRNCCPVRLTYTFSVLLERAFCRSVGMAACGRITHLQFAMRSPDTALMCSSTRQGILYIHLAFSDGLQLRLTLNPASDLPCRLGHQWKFATVRLSDLCCSCRGGKLDSMHSMLLRAIQKRRAMAWCSVFCILSFV